MGPQIHGHCIPEYNLQLPAVKSRPFIIAVNCVKENFTYTLITMKRQALFSETTVMGFCGRGDGLGTTQINKSLLYSQGVGRQRGSVDRITKRKLQE